MTLAPAHSTRERGTDIKGHIRKRGKGKNKWSVVIYLGRDPEGKPRYKWHSVDGTKPQAESELHRLLHEIDKGTYVEPNKLTVALYMEQWLDDYAKPNVAPTTYERYASIVHKQILPALGSNLLTKLQPTHISHFYAEVRKHGRLNGKGELAPRTVLQMHRILRKALQCALRQGLVSRNPADAVDAPRYERKEMRTLDADEVNRLLTYARGTHYYVPILVAVGTGMRRGEILALRWDDLDLEEGYAEVVRSLQQTRDGLAFKSPKSGRARKVVLPDVVTQGIRQHKAEQDRERDLFGSTSQENDLVCAMPDGSPYRPDDFSRRFHDFVGNADVPTIRFHDLRHTHATILMGKGVNPKVMSERLGHSNVSITLDIYSHVLPSMQEEAARKFDEALEVVPHPAK